MTMAAEGGKSILSSIYSHTLTRSGASFVEGGSDSSNALLSFSGNAISDNPQQNSSQVAAEYFQT